MSRLAARENPGNPRYSYTLAFFLHQKGADGEAADILEVLVEQAPGFASSYPLLGNLLGEGSVSSSVSMKFIGTSPMRISMLSLRLMMSMRYPSRLTPLVDPLSRST